MKKLWSFQPISSNHIIGAMKKEIVSWSFKSVFFAMADLVESWALEHFEPYAYYSWEAILGIEPKCSYSQLLTLTLWNPPLVRTKIYFYGTDLVSYSLTVTGIVFIVVLHSVIHFDTKNGLKIFFFFPWLGYF